MKFQNKNKNYQASNGFFKSFDLEKIAANVSLWLAYGIAAFQVVEYARIKLQDAKKGFVYGMPEDVEIKEKEVSNEVE